MRERLTRVREVERMRRLATSTDRLLDLTKQFQLQVVGHASLTPEDGKTLDEIVKAAREVRSRMTE